MKAYKQDKGVAGLTVLLTLITMLFVIGLIVMIFSLMSSNFQSATNDSTAKSVINIFGWTLVVFIGILIIGTLFQDNNVDTLYPTIFIF